MVRVEMEENPIMTIEINYIKAKNETDKKQIFCNAIPIILFMLKFCFNLSFLNSTIV